MTKQLDKSSPHEPGPCWRDLQHAATFGRLLPSKTRASGLLIAALSAGGALATHFIAGYVLLAYSRITGDPLPQTEMVLVWLFSLPVYAALLVGFCYGLAVLFTGRRSTAFRSETTQSSGSEKPPMVRRTTSQE